MAVDNLETEYHLTPHGWVVGTSYFFGKTEKEVAPPPDRVLTLVRKIYQSSRWSPEERSSWERCGRRTFQQSNLRHSWHSSPIPFKE